MIIENHSARFPDEERGRVENDNRMTKPLLTESAKAIPGLNVLKVYPPLPHVGEGRGEGRHKNLPLIRPYGHLLPQ